MSTSLDFFGGAGSLSPLVIEIAERFEKMFPVGHIITSLNPANPNTYGYNGTWVQIESDTSLVSVVGSSQLTNTITGSNTKSVPLPAHGHNASSSGITLNKRFNTNTTGNHAHSGNTNTTGNHHHTWTPRREAGGGTGSADSRNANSGYSAPNNTSSSGNHSHSFSTNTTGNHAHYTDVNFGSHSHTVTVDSTGTSGATIDVTGKHLKVYMWLRTA